MSLMSLMPYKKIKIPITIMTSLSFSHWKEKFHSWNSLKIFIFLFIVIFVIILLFDAYSILLTDTKSLTISDYNYKLVIDKSTTKVIVAWTTFWRDKQQDNFKGCPYKCFMTSDRNMAQEADAFIFHMTRQDFAYWNALIIPEQRPHFFNWTMTYRTDSDIFESYYGHKSIPNLPKINWDETWKVKLLHPKNKIVWFVSHCPTYDKRENYVHDLQKYIPVDIYGACGPLKCPRSKGAECEAKIPSYRFHLALENAICKDYVTEKLYHRMEHPTIPIVLKRSIYQGLFPNDGIIAVDDFESPKKLANYLHSLIENRSQYEQYFKWRERKAEQNFFLNPEYNSAWFSALRGRCKLCKMLHENQEHKTYGNLSKWWIQDSKCDNDFVPNLMNSLDK